MKAKILLNTDIIGLKKINIIILKKEAYINLYNITIAIDLKPRSKGITKRLIVIENKATLGPYKSAFIAVSYIILPSDRDFLFEL